MSDARVKAARPVCTCGKIWGQHSAKWEKSMHPSGCNWKANSKPSSIPALSLLPPLEWGPPTAGAQTRPVRVGVTPLACKGARQTSPEVAPGVLTAGTASIGMEPLAPGSLTLVERPSRNESASTCDRCPHGATGASAPTSPFERSESSSRSETTSECWELAQGGGTPTARATPEAWLSNPSWPR